MVSGLDWALSVLYGLLPHFLHYDVGSLRQNEKGLMKKKKDTITLNDESDHLLGEYFWNRH